MRVCVWFVCVVCTCACGVCACVCGGIASVCLCVVLTELL